ncbi:hypothetical protein DKT77_19010 [Meridianimarinicoccus roseus]|uniref:Uncharacterized protein n=1 Tax=Meridianimarinicoccus roseus TaxID=2072018 RepID=A0A2V2L6I0_9RHOB|nr:hypothetical protein DKT77_19010 [Meridianimarinicoccus roseus]
MDPKIFACRDILHTTTYRYGEAVSLGPHRLKCPSSDNLGRLSAFQTGGSGSPLIEVMRFQFRGASAGRAWFSV